MIPSKSIPLVLLTLLVFGTVPACSKENTSTKQAPFIRSLFHTIDSYDPFMVTWEVDAGDVNGDPLSYFWDFGNGIQREGSEKETVEYEPGQNYTVTVEVSDGMAPSVSKQTTLNAALPVATINLDPGISYQTIQGFGGFGPENQWWREVPVYSPEFIDRVINDLGVTILRDNIPLGFEYENDNDDPYLINWDGFNLDLDVEGSDSNLGQHLPYLKAMKEAGIEKLIASVWSPPIWMKHNDHRGNGVDDPGSPDAYSAPPYEQNPTSTTNQLRVSEYEEYAEYLVAYIETVKRETGLDVYAISPQNEPRFSQFYGSCVHSPASMRDLIKVIGSRFEEEGITTKIFAPEDVSSIYHIEQFLQAILDDPVATEMTDIFAIHNYANDGINPGDEGPSNWSRTHELAEMGGKEVWMTETSGFSLDHDGGMSLATSMYNAFRFGQANAWVYWQMSGPDVGDAVLIQNGVPNALYYVSKQYYRHIRPGSIRIEAESNSNEVLPLAFQPENGNGANLVLTNIGDGPVSLSFNAGDDILDKEYKVFQTTGENGYEELPETTTLREGMLIPPRSVMTLVSM